MLTSPYPCRQCGEFETTHTSTDRRSRTARRKAGVVATASARALMS
jgi:hypothetical protein